MGDAEIVPSDEDKISKWDDILREEDTSWESAFTQTGVVMEINDESEDETTSNLEEGKEDLNSDKFK